MRSFPKRFVRKFYYAFAGLFHGITKDHSIRLQACLGAIVLFVCLFLSLTWIQWCIIVMMILLVLAVEFLNSCIEQIVDVLFPDYDQRAKIIKDYAAAAVLLISGIAALAGIYIIGGQLWLMIHS